MLETADWWIEGVSFAVRYYENELILCAVECAHTGGSRMLP